MARAKTPIPTQLVAFEYIQVGKEIKFGEKALGTRMRLVTMKGSVSGKQYIQLWSSLSKEWKIMYRYNVEDEWSNWKKYASIHAKRQKQPTKGTVGRGDDVGRIKKPTRKQSKPKTSNKAAGVRKRTKRRDSDAK